MQYKGDDLDLRVPHARSARDGYPAELDAHQSNGRWARSASAQTMGPTEPLWVDEVVLACCNYAFDVAMANGAAEVGLEHLVNALTRVDTAARTLEARGVREGQLRRESAALIASEVPAANAGEAAAPRRSADLEDVLRRAAEIANRRGAAAGVEDVLWALVHYGRDVPVIHLLRRLAPDWQRADWLRLRDMPAPEPMPRAMPLVVPDAPAQSRLASLEDSLRLMQSEFAAERKLLMDLVRDIQRDVVAQRGDGAAFRGDLGQRLESLERTVQGRGDGTRLSLQLSDRLTGLEKSMQMLAGETSRGVRDVAHRLATLEAGLGQVGGSGVHDSLAERMTALEKAVHGGLGEGARNWAHLGQRLASLETALEARGEASGLEAIAGRIGALEKLILSGLGDASRNIGQIVHRLSALEATAAEAGKQGGEIGQQLAGLGRAIEAARSEASLVRADVSERMSFLEAQLAEAPQRADGPGVREFTDRLGGLERAVRSGFGEATLATSQMMERLVTLEKGVGERPRDDGEAMLILDDRLGAIERILETRGEQTLSATADIIQRLHVLEQRPSAMLGSDQDLKIHLVPVESRIASLEATSMARVEALQTGLADIVARLSQVDERMKAEAIVTEEALRGRDQDFDFIYNEIKQLGQSQATLNSAVNDWRNESQTHFGTLATRLDKLQTAPSPVATPVVAATAVAPAGKETEAALATGAAAKASATIGADVRADDYALPPEPGRGFWYWLFGTSSLGRAHREHELKVTRMRQNIREARDRRRLQA